MNKWQEVLLSPDTPILKAISIIDISSLQIALVIDEEGRLLGTVTDGDIRRGILRGVPMSAAIADIMFRTPTVARLNDSREQILSLMKAQQLRQIPVLDEERRVVGIEMLNYLIQEQALDNWVFLMAGGSGIRLRPLTESCPKPLLRVGNKPILESIVESFIEYGFRKFFISVNYKSEMVEEYFGDGTRWGIDIQYVREKQKLGTAGSLRLLPELPDEPIFVMNGDLLTKVNFRQLLDFHRLHGSDATMCVREFDFQVPYGVVRVDRHRLLNVEEKPVQRFFVNAGIYLIQPRVIDLIPPDAPFDMPDLFKFAMEKKLETVAFPIREYWLDIGRMEDFELANVEYPTVFTSKPEGEE